MASIRKRDGRWRVQIRRRGHPPQFHSFDQRGEAVAWAQQMESEMYRGVFIARTEAERTTLAEILDRYAREVTPGKASAEREKGRIARLKKQFGVRYVAQLRPSEIAAYRDQRLAEGRAGATVAKELQTLSHAIDTARREWGIYLPENPVKLVRRPKVAPGRDRRLEPGEEVRLLDACARSRAPALSMLVQLALETAMRLGELLSLRWRNVDLAKRTVFLPHTKSGTTRTVPLTAKATQLLSQWPRSTSSRVFPQWSSPFSIENAWRRALRRAEITNLRFHDLRYEATTRLFERGLNPMQAAAITGHRSLAMLKRYTHLRAEDLVVLLDRS